MFDDFTTEIQVDELSEAWRKYFENINNIDVNNCETIIVDTFSEDEDNSFWQDFGEPKTIPFDASKLTYEEFLKEFNLYFN